MVKTREPAFLGNAQSGAKGRLPSLPLVRGVAEVDEEEEGEAEEEVAEVGEKVVEVADGAEAVGAVEVEEADIAVRLGDGQLAEHGHLRNGQPVVEDDGE